MKVLDKEFETGLYIDGVFRRSASGETFDVVNPSTGAVIAQVDAASPADVEHAVRAAYRQYDDGAWSRMPGAQRGRLLHRLADLLERDADFLAHLEALDNGKPVGIARMADVANVIATFRYFAGWADKLEGRTIPTSDPLERPTFSYTVREPLGVIGAISAYNCPTMYVGWKAAPALAAGNTVVLKPPEEAPLTTLYIARLFGEAGFPPGVFNVVPGLGPVAGTALVRHPLVAKISFTGGGRVGRLIAHDAAETLKPLTLELGGKAPQIVLADADLANTIPALAMGIFANQGQICAAGTRIVVHRSLQRAVAEALADCARAQTVGDPLDPATTMGPMTTLQGARRVLEYVEKGKAEGAQLLAGGRPVAGPGYFVEPAIFSGTNDHAIAQDEIFGPVATVIPFDTHDEAIRIANDTPYGLNAGIFTRDVTDAHLLSRRLRTGAVWVNGWGLVDPRLPWGGVKASGYGRENGANALDDVTHEKVVTAVLVGGQ